MLPWRRLASDHGARQTAVQDLNYKRSVRERAVCSSSP
uniref:Uncharacterized protein n=1 Tax=Anguilla anguilla TaxID=7936 RepID=A0A0E9XQQ1_ANGAN